MAKQTTNITVKVEDTVIMRINSGMPSPAQKAAWRELWQRLIAEVASGSEVENKR